jgi:starch-binding outer membrane protein SusE/F
MKHFTKILFIATLILGIWSCKKDENKVVFEGGTRPVLTSSLTPPTPTTFPTIPLSFITQNEEAIKLNWTNPEYRFNTGVSSQNVNYSLEIDTVGAGFTNPNRQTISISSSLSRTFTQNELNTYLLGMNLTTGISHPIQLRVRASLANGAAPLFSNTLSFNATPFAIPPKVTPPASGKLFIVGSATPNGWNNPVPVPSQEFTKVSNTMYTITLSLNGGQFYLFLPVNGDWGAKFGAMGGNGSNNPDGDDFKPGGGDFIAPSVSGTYKIEVNFQTGRTKLTKL